MTLAYKYHIYQIVESIYANKNLIVSISYLRSRKNQWNILILFTLFLISIQWVNSQNVCTNLIALANTKGNYLFTEECLAKYLAEPNLSANMQRQIAYTQYQRHDQLMALLFLESTDRVEDEISIMYLAQWYMDVDQIEKSATAFKLLPHGLYIPRLLNLGNNNLNTGHLEKALTNYKVLLFAEPDLPAGWHGIARTYYRRSELSNAEHAYNHLLRLDRDNAIAHHELGMLLWKEDIGIDQALYHLNQAVILSPEKNGVGLRHIQALVEFQWQQNRLEEAVFQAQEGLLRFPANRSLNNMLGQMLWQSHRSSDAILLFEDAILYDPEYPHYYFLLGQILYENQNYTSAVTLFGKAVALDGQNRHYLRYYGQALEDVGEHELAITQYCHIIQSHPDWLVVQNRLINLQQEFPSLSNYCDNK